MKIIKNGLTVEIHGKCISEYDVLTMYKFGYSIDGIARRYADDNKIKKTEADKIIIEILYKNAMKR